MERFDRLLLEQQSAIVQTDAKIEKLQNYAGDYVQLKSRLDSLSKCFTKSSIIPFSPRALVPAQIIHTNEVLVHMGGCADHFCEVSTFQANSLIDKRIARINTEVKRLREQRGLLVDRESYTKKLCKSEAPMGLNPTSYEAQTDEYEIKEEYDEEKEAEWLANHKKRVQAERQKKCAVAEITDTPANAIKGSSNQPVLSTTRRSVRFVCNDESSSDSSLASDIAFSHSNYPAKTFTEDIDDWSQASPADVVAHVQKRNTSKNPNNFIESSTSPSPQLPPTTVISITNQSRLRSSPFGEVTERRESISGVPECSEPSKSEKHISRFRGRRKQQT